MDVDLAVYLFGCLFELLLGCVFDGDYCLAVVALRIYDAGEWQFGREVVVDGGDSDF